MTISEPTGTVDNEPDEAGAPTDGTTLVAILQGYADAGWATDMSITAEGRVRCAQCGTESDGTSVGYQSVRRLEGASDPGDEMAVYAVTCPHCGAGGTLVIHFAADASPEEIDLLQQLVDDRDGPSPLPTAGPPTEGPGVEGPAETGSPA
jgi:hypothetical protein